MRDDSIRAYVMWAVAQASIRAEAEGVFVRIQDDPGGAVILKRPERFGELLVEQLEKNIIPAAVGQ